MSERVSDERLAAIVVALRARAAACDCGPDCAEPNGCGTLIAAADAIEQACRERDEAQETLDRVLGKDPCPKCGSGIAATCYGCGRDEARAQVAALREALEYARDCETADRDEHSLCPKHYAIVVAALAASGTVEVPVPAGHSAGEMSAAVKGAGSGERSAVGGDPPHGTSITLSRARLLALVERAVRAGMDAEGAVRAWGDLPKSPPSIAARVLKEWGQP